MSTSVKTAEISISVGAESSATVTSLIGFTTVGGSFAGLTVTVNGSATAAGPLASVAVTVTVALPFCSAR